MCWERMSVVVQGFENKEAPVVEGSRYAAVVAEPMYKNFPVLLGRSGCLDHWTTSMSSSTHE